MVQTRTRTSIVAVRWAVPLVLIAFCAVGFRPPALIDSSQGMTGAPSALFADAVARARVPPVPPIQASAAAVVDGDTGALLWGKYPHSALAPASMTKMMTALVALERGNLERVVTANVDASAMVGDSVMGLHPTERLSLRDLMYGLLVPSGDDAALAIARAIAGDDASFVGLMNAAGVRLGLTETHFVNPHGLDATGHRSSPYDMIVIARYAMRYSLFRQIVSTQHVTIHGQWTYDLTNTNALLGRRPGVVGVKTGTTDLALHAITVADNETGHLLYATVMHTPNYVPDVTALLNYFVANDRWVTLGLPESPLNHVAIAGKVGDLVVADDSTIILSNWQSDTLASRLDLTPDAMMRATDDPDLPPANHGAATFSAAGDSIARLPLAIRE